MKQYTGRTLDEVLNAISTEQGCRVEDITYNVLEEEKGGIFGLHKSVTIEAFTSKEESSLLMSAIADTPSFHILSIHSFTRVAFTSLPAQSRSSFI